MDGREEELRELVELRQDKAAGMQSQVDELKRETERMERQAEKARGLAEECQQKLEASEKAYAAQKNRILTAENEFKTLSNRNKIPEDLENSFEGYSKSIQSVMNEKRFGSLKNASIFGPVSALIKTEGRYVTAVEAAVGGACLLYTSREWKQAYQGSERTFR